MAQHNPTLLQRHIKIHKEIGGATLSTAGASNSTAASTVVALGRVRPAKVQDSSIAGFSFATPFLPTQKLVPKVSKHFLFLAETDGTTVI